MPSSARHYFVFYANKSTPVPGHILEKFTQKKIIYVKDKKLSRVKYVRALIRPHVKLNPKIGEIDVLFQADATYGVPKNIPTVVVFYDIIPLLFKSDNIQSSLNRVAKLKQVFAERIQGNFYKEFLNSYKNARAIIAISDWSKKDYISYIDSSSPEKITVTHLGVSPKISSKMSELEEVKVLRAFGVGKSPYLLYVGAIDQRKNVIRLAMDFIELKKEWPDLLLVGAGKEFCLSRNLKMIGWTNMLNSSPLQAKDIITPGYVSDENLGVLYRNAAVFVFPSRYEGFGLPVLEAMQLDCPVVCYDNSSLTEVVGSAALIVKDGEPMAPAINRFLSNDALRQEYIKRGRSQVKKFDWGKTAAQTLEVIENVAKKN